MRDQLVETIVGAIVLVTAAVFLTYALNTGGSQGGRGAEYVARFDSADGLSVGSDVRISGVKVGSVADVELDPTTFQARVLVSVGRDFELPVDSAVSLRNEGLLGGIYLAVEPGVEVEFMQPGDEFAYGQGAIDVIRLLAEFIAQGGSD